LASNVIAGFTTLAVLVGLALTAMQVGLATQTLSDSAVFRLLSPWYALAVTCSSLVLSLSGLLSYFIWYIGLLRTAIMMR
jgi:hypothetical protein